LEAIVVKSTKLLLLAVAVVGLQACTAAHLHSLNPKGQDITGLWMGTSTSFVAAGGANISLAVFQEGDGKFSGLFDCDPGNSFCRNMIRGGTLRGNTSSSTFKVDLEDRSWCTFSGGFLPEIADGHYSCYYDDGRVDRGIWNVKLQRWRPTPAPGTTL
jgi:hypothetical protein